MAIIPIKAWYLEKYEPIKEVLQRPHDLRLSKNSLLKSGLRADFLDDSQDVQASLWFERYLAGEKVEFYLQGSGGYTISNIDLISQEIYFTKQEIAAYLEPIIFFSYQTEYAAAREALTSALAEVVKKFNEKSRFPLILELSPRSENAPMRLSKNQLRKIRKSLLFIADATPLAAVEAENQTNLLLNPNVCLEIGYALETKDTGQILLLTRERPDLKGKFPFELPPHQQLSFNDASELVPTLPKMMESLLQRFNLLA